VIAIVLFVTAIGMAIKLQAKSLQLAAGLRRSKMDNVKIIAVQREFNAVFESVGDGIVIFSENEKLMRSNKMARDFLAQNDAVTAVERLKALLPDFSDLDEKSVKVHQIKTEDDRTIQCRIMKLAINEQVFIYCVLTDITAEERLATARASFIATINHELRTPLTSLAGSLELLESRFSEPLSAPAKRLVTMATRNADRLLMLVNDILTLQAIDQGQFHLRSKAVAVESALDEAVATNAGYGLGAGVDIVCERWETGHIFVDPDRLQQVFSNLISNAVKYSQRGSSVLLGAVTTEDEVTFYVRDSGPGIPKSARGRLFDRFTAPIHERGVQMGGTGLGLAITKQLIERQDGSISFETLTEEDEMQHTGTVFYISFPLYDVVEAQSEVAA